MFLSFFGNISVNIFVWLMHSLLLILPHLCSLPLFPFPTELSLLFSPPQSSKRGL